MLRQRRRPDTSLLSHSPKPGNSRPRARTSMWPCSSTHATQARATRTRQDSMRTISRCETVRVPQKAGTEGRSTGPPASPPPIGADLTAEGHGVTAVPLSVESPIAAAYFSSSIFFTSTNFPPRAGRSTRRSTATVHRTSHIVAAPLHLIVHQGCHFLTDEVEHLQRHVRLRRMA